VSGSIKQTVQLQLQIGAHVESIAFGVTNLGKRKECIFLGMDRLNTHNPGVDWKTKQLNLTQCPKECEIKMVRTLIDELDSIKINELAEEDEISDTKDPEYEDRD
jgi:hypothetical protein